MKIPLPFLFISICFFAATSANGKVTNFQKWENPLIKVERLNSPLVEVEPFVLGGEFYLLECWRSNWNWPGQPSITAGNESEMWIAKLHDGPEDYYSRSYIFCAMKGNELGTAIVWKNRVYVFGVNGASDRQYVEMTWSDDLKNWSTPVKVMDSPAGKIFNVSLTRDKDGFVFLWETNGVGTKYFTMCFGHIDNLSDNWNDNIIKNAVYGEDKYTGGPEVVYAGGWYYLLYLERLENGWETRVTRSKDLINWQDSVESRPFLTFDKSHKNLPVHEPDVAEKNASDPGVVLFNGQVIVYFTGGIQKKAGDLQWAKYDGSLKKLMRSYFK